MMIPRPLSYFARRNNVASVPRNVWIPAFVGRSSSSIAVNALSQHHCGNKNTLTTRSLSSSSSSSVKVNPSYQVYGEMAALTLKAIPPEFRKLGSNTVVLDAKQRGRILLVWTARNPDGRYAWDQPVRFALSPEEAGSLIAKLPRLESVELARRTPMGPMQKVFRAVPRPDGSVQFVVDYELEGEGGQEPPSEKEAKGPLEVSLMSGEYQVIKSIITYSLPRLVGWSTMLDHSIEQSFSGANTPSPHNYSAIRDDTDVPF